MAYQKHMLLVIGALFVINSQIVNSQTNKKQDVTKANNGQLYAQEWEKRENGYNTEYWKLKAHINDSILWLVLRPDDTIIYIEKWADKPGDKKINTNEVLEMYKTLKSQWKYRDVNGKNMSTLLLPGPYRNGVWYAVDNGSIPEIWEVLDGNWKQSNIYGAIDSLIKPRQAEKWFKIVSDGYDKYLIPIETITDGKIFMEYKNNSVTFWRYDANGWNWKKLNTKQYLHEWIRARWEKTSNGYAFKVGENYYAISNENDEVRFMQEATHQSKLTMNEFMRKLLELNNDIIVPYSAVYAVFTSTWTGHKYQKGKEFRRIILREISHSIYMVYHSDKTYSFLKVDINTGKELELSNEEITNLLLQASGLILTIIDINMQKVQALPIADNLYLVNFNNANEIYEGDNKINYKQAVSKIKQFNSTWVRQNNQNEDTIVIPIASKHFYKVYVWFKSTYFNKNGKFDGIPQGESFIMVKEDKVEFVFVNADTPKKVDYKKVITELTHPDEVWYAYDGHIGKEVDMPIDEDDDGKIYLAYNGSLSFWQWDQNNAWNGLEFNSELAKWIANKWDRREDGNDTLVVTTVHDNKRDIEYRAVYNVADKTFAYYKVHTKGTLEERSKMNLKDFVSDIIHYNRQKIEKWHDRKSNRNFDLGDLIHIGPDGIRVGGDKGINISRKGINVGGMVKLNFNGLFGGVFSNGDDDLYGPPGVNVLGKLVHVGPDGVNVGNVVKIPFGIRKHHD